ncbi:hypothetical protein MASR2M70_12950 [Bacillota bacterium]
MKSTAQVFINFSNHNYNNWSNEQKKATEIYGQVIDMDFPRVSPHFNETIIAEMAENYSEQIKSHYPTAVLCQGEMTLAFAVIRRLQEHGVKVIAACSERNTEEAIDENGNCVKTTKFKFVRFREYV